VVWFGTNAIVHEDRSHDSGQNLAAHFQDGLLAFFNEIFEVAIFVNKHLHHALFVDQFSSESPNIVRLSMA
jgi:hypothetical protein